MSAPRFPKSPRRKGPRTCPVRPPGPLRVVAVVAAVATALAPGPAGAQSFLFDNLRAFPERPGLGDPGMPAALGNEGPKGIAAADFNRDDKPDLAVSNLDGTVTVLIGRGSGDFAPPVHLQTGARTLRGIIAADLDNDGAPDIATAAPYEGQIYLFHNRGDDGGDDTVIFRPAVALEAWTGARNLAAGDFDGDGVTDLAVAGPGHGLRHYRGTGGAGGEEAFEVLADLPELSPQESEFPKPVYVLEVLPVEENGGWVRDELLVTHADADRVWRLGTVAREAGTGTGASDPAAQALPEGVAGVAAGLIITEFMADNDGVLADADGEFPDWIEVFNRSAEPLNLAGWGLSDNPDRPFKWSFPEIVLGPGRYLVVFASGNDRRDPVGELHTNFKLAAGGEALALTAPGGDAGHRFDPFPAQIPERSYGIDHAGEPRFFSRPSPGAQNNAGVADPDDLQVITLTGASFDPQDPPADAPVAVTVQLTGTEAVEAAWFGYRPRADLVLVRLTPVEGEPGAGAFTVTLPAGRFTPGDPFEIFVRTTDGRTVSVLDAAAVAAPKPGALAVLSSFPSQPARAMDTGRLLTPELRPGEIGPATPVDLITANRDRGTLEIRAGNGFPHRFDHPVVQTIEVTGGPRSVSIADLDGDGWNDLVVALRGFNKLVAFRNRGDSGDGGGWNGFEEEPSSEVPTGVSPRAVVTVDLNGDGQPDSVVINRVSGDLSVVLTVPDEVAFGKLDQVLPTDGEVTGLVLADIDGRWGADVVQLHRTAGSLSVRLSGPDGELGEPDYYPYDDYPSTPGLVDCNGDGRPDAIVGGITGDGTIEVRLNLGGGRFGPVIKTTVPPSDDPLDNRGYIGMSYGDFDRDDKVDLALLYFDCRIGFFRGNGDGTFEHTHTHDFIPEDRVVLPEDLDGDGDIDLVGISYDGRLVVIENPGIPGDGGGLNLLTVESLAGLRTVYPAPGDQHLGARDLRALDINADGDLDLVVGTGYGVLVYLGADGVGFELQEGIIEGTEFPVAGLAVGNFDGEGPPELAVSCKERSCVKIYALEEPRNGDEGDEGGAAGRFRHALTADVPAGDYIAAGDIDGDGTDDLAGAGDVLWVALSIRPAAPGDPRDKLPPREPLTGPVINEVLAINGGFEVAQDGGKRVDFVEIFSKGEPGAEAEPADLSGWRLVLHRPGPPAERREFTFPENAVIEPGGHLLVFYSRTLRSPFHTGFRLPGDGAALELVDARGTVVDRVDYPRQQTDVAYGRYQDGLPAFAFNGTPSPGTPNRDSGPVDPVLTYEGVDVATLGGGEKVRFFARGRDDVGIVNVSVLYRQLDLGPGTEPQLAVLFDDGLHGDGERLDGLYSGTTAGPLPPEAEIEFYFEATDLTGAVSTVPDGAAFGRPGERNRLFSLGITADHPLQIVEVVADNSDGLQDEHGGTPDYILVRNAGNDALSLDGVSLAQTFAADPADRFDFPPGITLGPGEEIPVYLDGRPAQGALHAPFGADNQGDFFILLGTATHGARTVLDHVATPALGEDEAFRRVAGTPVWRAGAPGVEFALPWTGFGRDAAGRRVLAHVFTTEVGFLYRVETSEDLASWEALKIIEGNGQPALVTVSGDEGGDQRFFRFDRSAIDPEAGEFTAVTAVAYSPSAVEIRGTITVEAGRAVPELTFLYRRADAEPGGEDWDEATIGVRQGPFVGYVEGLTPGTTYQYRLRAAVGAVETWTELGSFTTLPAGAPSVMVIADPRPGTRRAVIEVVAESDVRSLVTVFWGSKDGGLDPRSWAEAAVLPDVDGSTEAMIEGLNPGTTSFFRFRVQSADGATTWSAPGSSLRTRTELEALRQDLVVSEIHYNPPWELFSTNRQEGEPLAADLEFIEFYNVGEEPLDLGEVQVEQAVEFAFSNSAITVLQPGQVVLVVRNNEVFEAHYGTGLPVAGEWFNPLLAVRLNQLSNAGEQILITYSRRRQRVLEFSYDDVGDEADTDGGGRSQILIEPSARPEHDDWNNWMPSVELGGSPGRIDGSPGSAFALRAVHWLSLRGDLDADGDIDFLQPASSVALRLLLNVDGATGFQLEPTEVVLPPRMGSIRSQRLVDFDRDGYPDLLARNESGALWLLRNLAGTGVGLSFEEVVLLPGIGSIHSLELIDFDGDDYPDLLTKDSSGVFRLLRNLTGGGVGRSVAEVAIATADAENLPRGGRVAWVDLDGDSFPELLVRDEDPDRFRLFLNLQSDAGSRFLQEHPEAVSEINRPPFTDQNVQFAWADYDGDGDLDLLVPIGEGDDRITVFGYARVGGAGHTFTPVFSSSEQLSSPRWIDDDSDGFPDIWDRRGNLVMNVAGTGGTRTFENPVNVLPDEYLRIEDWRDFDLDGSSDILATANNSVRVYLNEGRGFAPSLPPPVLDLQIRNADNGPDAYPIDYDGDGDIDIFVSWCINPSGQEYRYHRIIMVNQESPRDGTRRFLPFAFPFPGLPLAAFDVDNDGDNDFLLRTEIGNALIETLDPKRMTLPLPPTDPLVVTEIMYHARRGGNANDDRGDYIELANVSNEPADLTAYRFIRGVEFEFADGAIKVLQPGERVVVVHDEESFERRYGEGLPVAGEYSGRLSNRADTITLVAGLASPTYLQILYNDEIEATDGDGYALEFIYPESTYLGGPTFVQGRFEGGSPGIAEEDPANARFSGSWLAPADIDQDGDLDVVTPAENVAGMVEDPLAEVWLPRLRLYTNVGGRDSFQFARTEAEFPPSSWATWTQVDGDGFPDLLIRDSLTRAFRLFLNLEGDGGGRSFEESPEATSGLNRSPFTGGVSSWDWDDFDSDGDADLLLTRNSGDETVTTVWRNDQEGRSGLGLTESFSTSAKLEEPEWVDHDDDGFPDIWDRNGKLLKNVSGPDGSRVFGGPVQALPEGATIIGWLEFNGDSYIDILAFEPAGAMAVARLYLNGGPQAGFTFMDSGLELPPFDPAHSLLTYFNDDGFPDLLLRASVARLGGGVDLILINEEAADGGRRFATPIHVVAQRPVDSGDFDGDGDIDYVMPDHTIPDGSGVRVLDSFVLDPTAHPASLSPLVVTEIMYHSPLNGQGGSDHRWDYVVLKNLSADPVDLTTFTLTGSIKFDFSSGMITTLNPGERVIVVSSEDDFEARYGPGRVAGEFEGTFLPNGGGTVAIANGDKDGVPITIFRVTYSGDLEATSGNGFALEIDYTEFGSAIFRAGTVRNGNPLRTDFPWIDYSGWKEIFFTPGEMELADVSGEAADPDSDGVINFREFAFGTDPKVPGGIPVRAVEIDGYAGLSFPYSPYSHGVKFLVHSSPDLKNWSLLSRFSVAPGSRVPVGSNLTASVDSEGRATAWARSPVKLRFFERRFFRLDIGRDYTLQEDQSRFPPAWLDYEGDGDLDLLVGRRLGRNLGHAFVNWEDVQLGEAGPETDGFLGWMDLDGDGDADAVVRDDRYWTHVLFHDSSFGDGRFTHIDLPIHVPFIWRRTHWLPDQWGDADGDGDLDLIDPASSRLFVFEWPNGGQELSMKEEVPNWPPMGPATIQGFDWADFDGDGLRDLVVARGEFRRAWVLRRTDEIGSWSFDPPIEVLGADELRWGDLDRDGRADLLFSRTDFVFAGVLQQRGGPGGAPAFPFDNEGVALLTNAASLLWVDFDSDGYPDIVVDGASAALDSNGWVWQNIATLGGERTVAPLGTNLPLPNSFGNGHIYATWADYDDDGNLDVFIHGSERSGLYRNEGGGRFVEQ